MTTKMRWKRDDKHDQWLMILPTQVFPVAAFLFRDSWGYPMVMAWRPDHLDDPMRTGDFLDSVRGPSPFRRGSWVERRDSRRWTDKTMRAWGLQMARKYLEHWEDISSRVETGQVLA